MNLPWLSTRTFGSITGTVTGSIGANRCVDGIRNFAVPRAAITTPATVGTINAMARVLNGETATREINLGLRFQF